MTDSVAIDARPLPVRRPETVAELGELVRETSAAGHGLYPVAGRTALGLGLPPLKPGVAADLTALSQVIDYPARDMTVTVQAGLTLEKLQQTLAAEGQYLPLDVPHPDRCTVGGAIAANLSGPRRLAFGTARDLVIGISFVDDAGTEVKGGGRVVKNVAGYDLMKLHVGAVGTLGVVTQLTLKVQPTPERQAVVAFGMNAASVGPTLDRLHASASRPVAVELLNAAAAKATGLPLPETDPWVILCGFAEKATTVEWQVRTLLAELKTAPVRDAAELPDPRHVWPAVTGLQDRAAARLTLKVTGRPSKLAAIAAAAATFPDLVTHAHAGSGILYAHADAADLTAEAASGMVTALAAATDANGSVTVRKCPPEWKAVLPVWGQPRGDRTLMRTVKLALDPKNVFNPGRLFGDL